jgi:hypothetical protein
MAPKWLSKVPWTSIAELVLSWWKGRKKDDNPKTGSQDKKPDNGAVVDSDKAPPVE